MNKIFIYTVVIYDDTYYEEDNYCLESGLLAADCYTNAMDQLEVYYTPRLTRIVDLAETDNEMIILPSNIVHAYAHGTYDECTVPCDRWGNKLTESNTKIDWNIQEPTTTAEI